VDFLSFGQKIHIYDYLLGKIFHALTGNFLYWKFRNKSFYNDNC